MSQIIIFGLGVILGGIVVWAYLFKTAQTKTSEGDNAPPVQTIIEKQAEEKQKNMQKILDFLAQKRDGTITNDEVQKLLSFSDASAERYLDELEKEGRLKQVGKTGVKTYYQKI